MPKGNRPKNCYARSDSPYWWYEISIKGNRESGSTGYEEAELAAEYVQTRRAALRAEIEGASNNPVVAAITGEHRKHLQEELTWEQALDAFHQDCIVGTDDERNALRRAVYLLEALGDVPFHSITHADLFKYRQDRLKQVNRYGNPISPLTANRDLAHARQVFNHMNDLGVRMPPNWPNWSKLIDSEAEHDAARTRALSTDEEARLFAAIRTLHPDMEGFIEFILLSGQRKAAIVNLCHADIDWQDRSFKVRLKSKGRKKRIHTVALTKRMAEIIEAQPKVETTDRVFTYVCERSRLRKDGPGYIRKKGQRYGYTVGGWKKRWAAILEEAEIDDFHVHDLRHTNATRIVRSSRDINAAKEVLGHRQLSTTQRYVHADLEDQRRALQEAEDMRREHQEGLRKSKFPPLKVVGEDE